MRLDILGGFWQGQDDVVAYFPFMGEIELTEITGELTGKIADYWGTSNIVGKMQNGSLSYVKTYLPGSKGDVNPITYDFTPLAGGSVGMVWSASCWLGKYQLVISDKDRGNPVIEAFSTNKAYCLITEPGVLP